MAWFEDKDEPTEPKSLEAVAVHRERKSLGWDLLHAYVLDIREHMSNPHQGTVQRETVLQWVGEALALSKGG